ncbi:MAG: sigma-54-dependent Fis family transcriptional regulator [Deltaproteobacteria bacterium]|nr:sigma-54-dependent Fis family transcriptional regulator [Deltaproteobacteria bacterium]
MPPKLKHKKIRILIADDEKNFSSIVKEELAQDGLYVETASNGKEALLCLQQGEFDVILLDINMPHLNGIEVLNNYQRDDLPPEFIIVTGNASVPTAIEAMKLGAYDYITKPCKIEKLKVLIQKAWDKRMIRRDNLIFRSRLIDDTEIATKNPVMLEILDTAKMIAKANLSVLISGESGTGKELMARFIHESSRRAGGSFIAFNAGAIPDSILESELFGYEKGAFTGADRNKPGYFELADRGTLFLDEIGDISPSMQAKLLRSIETNKFFKVGGTKEIEVDIRIIAATNKDLKKEVEANRFRHDLFYRLGAMNIHLPPLKERRGDIPLLVEKFLVAERERKKVDGDVLKRLIAYSWPGNIRELKNIIQRAIILCKNEIITIKDLPLEFQNPVEIAWTGVGAGLKPAPVSTIQEVEKEHIKGIMKQVDGHRGKASQILGINPKTLYRKIKEYGLE